MAKYQFHGPNLIRMSKGEFLKKDNIYIKFYTNKTSVWTKDPYTMFMKSK